MFLVAGGNDDSWDAISSTELMLEDSDVWSITSPLPRAVYGVKGVTLGNTLYMSGRSYYYCIMYTGIIICITGGYDEDDNERDEILAWSDEKKEWDEVGKMKEGRALHAISTINVDEVATICG